MNAYELAQLIAPGKRPRSGGQGRYQVPCPAHDDKNPSLTVWVDEKGKAAFNCHAGCAHEAILHKLPQDASDAVWGTWKAEAIVLRMPSRPSADGTIRYAYRHPDGSLAYHIVRTPDKRFRLEPAGAGPILYNLPEIATALGNGDPIYVVEGEKDADNLTARGLCATTSPFGAGKFSKVDSSILMGAPELYVIPDNDEPGRNHAQQVADITGAKILELPGLPEKGDVSDWLGMGHTVEELRGLVGDDKRTGVLFGSMLDYAAGDLANLPQPVTLLGAYFQAGGVNVIYGRGGSFKSFVAQSASASIATGHPWGHLAVRESSPTVYWAAEGRSGLHKRFHAWEAHTGQRIAPGRLLVPEKWPRLDDPALGEFIADELESVGCKWVTIDTLNRTKGKLKENDSDDLGSILFDVLTPSLLRGIGVCIVHHSGWNNDHARGSSALFDNADQVYKITKDGKTVTLHDEKGKDNAERPILYFSTTEIGQSVVVLPSEERPLHPTAGEILKALQDGQWWDTEQLTRATGFDRKRIGEHMAPLVGRLVEKEVPGRGQSARYRTLTYGVSVTLGDRPDTRPDTPPTEKPIPW